MQYLEPVYRGKCRGENYEYVHIVAHGIKAEERLKLEEIARTGTYVFRIMGNHKHSEAGGHCRYRGIRNKVRFVNKGGVTHVYVHGPYATDMGFKIEDLSFVEFSPSKQQVVTFSEESREDLVAKVLDYLEPL